MEHLTKEDLFFLLEENHADITLKTIRGAEVSVSPILHFSSKEEPYYKGYSVSTEESNHRCQTYLTLLNYLKTLRVESSNGYELVSINDEFRSLSEYRENLAFEKATMAELISRYENIADSFELVCMFPDCHYPAEEGEPLLFDCRRRQKEREQKFYADLKREDPTLLPYAEYEQALQKIFDTYEDEMDAMCALNDYVESNSETVLPLLYHLYSYFGIQRERVSYLNRLANCKKQIPLDDELNEEKYLPLKPYLLSETLSFSSHCTESGYLQKIYRFRLTEETKAWLKQFHTDYDLEGLEDLAFYHGDTLLFSSCTHEHFHNDLL